MKEINLLTLSHHALSLYTAVCRPLCQTLEIPQTAFDILMFLTNHQELCTAREITEYSGIKKNLVSVNVEKLVSQGYLEREAVPSDRRQVKLIVTKKALSVIDQGRQLQKFYYDTLTQGFNEEEREICQTLMQRIASNMDSLEDQLKRNPSLI